MRVNSDFSAWDYSAELIRNAYRSGRVASYTDFNYVGLSSSAPPSGAEDSWSIETSTLGLSRGEAAMIRLFYGFGSVQCVVRQTATHAEIKFVCGASPEREEILSTIYRCLTAARRKLQPKLQPKATRAPTSESESPGQKGWS
jgi:hypothetical protein